MVRAALHEPEIRRLIGLAEEGEAVVEGVATLDERADHCLYFLNREATPAEREALSARRGCIVIAPVGSGLAGALGSCRVLEAPQPRTAVARILGFIRAERRQPPWLATRRIAPSARISPLAVVEGDVEIGEAVVIEPFCTVGPDVAIGRGSVLRAGARVFPRVSIGEETVVGANAVIGSEGYGFVRDEAGHKLRIPQLGGIRIGSHVEIGALALVQRGTLVPTAIEDYVKIDDCAAIGHNVRIGRGPAWRPA